MPEAKSKAVQLFTDFKERNVTVPPNLRWMVYAAGIKYGDSDDWNFAWHQYRTSFVPSETSLWMRALTESSNPYILQRYLDATQDPKLVRKQDVSSVVSSIAKNPAGSQIAWRHLQMRWTDLVKKFGAGSFMMGSLIEATIAQFSTEFDYEQVRRFFRPRRAQVGSGQRALDQSMENIRIHVEWRNNHEENLRRWIVDKLGPIEAEDNLI